MFNNKIIRMGGGYGMFRPSGLCSSMVAEQLIRLEPPPEVLNAK